MNDLDEAHYILSKSCYARVNSYLNKNNVKNTFAFHDECSTIYNSSLQKCIEVKTFCYHQNNDWYYAHDNESKLSLNNECHNICSEEKQNALNECICYKHIKTKQGWSFNQFTVNASEFSA